VRVRSFFKRRIVRIGGAALACVALVALILWVLPRPHQPLHYMIAGTAGTIVWLGLVFAMLLRGSRPAIRRVRRSGQPG
jgi:peptidoglycan/LPS O-acetylase OafA/YrhL